MSVEPNVASFDYMGDRFTFFDCPGSVEFTHNVRFALPVCDAAVVVCEADPRKAPALQVILRELEELSVPRILFLNKIDLAGGGVRETLQILQPASRAPLLLRQIPIWENGVATGFVDLALERAFVYREAQPSVVVEMPGGVASDEKQARYSMLERLADYDDELMEQLISDIEPPRDRRVRRSRARTAGGPRRAPSDGIGDRRPWRDAAPQGAAPRRRRASRRRGRASGSRRRGRRWPRSSAPSTPRMAANCRWRECCAALFPTAPASPAPAAPRSASPAWRGWSERPPPSCRAPRRATRSPSHASRAW